jgi:hypothetical protein
VGRLLLAAGIVPAAAEKRRGANRGGDKALLHD